MVLIQLRAQKQLGGGIAQPDHQPGHAARSLATQLSLPMPPPILPVQEGPGWRERAKRGGCLTSLQVLIMLSRCQTMRMHRVRLP